jgi:undecaprenyl-phosphate galactose phosphotransferase
MLHDAHYIFLALEGSEIERYQAALKSLPRARVPCSIIPPWIGLPSSTLSPHHFMMDDVMMLHDTNRLTLLLPRLIKRLTDIVLAGSALLVATPALIVVALLVRRDGGPAFFKQVRVGRNGELFECYKFRSMRADAEQVLGQYLADNPEAAAEWGKFQKLKDDVRVTKFGDFIRRTSIDELPQLINVVKGEMSLVGPRPCMPGQESLYAEDFSFYESVRPGITGPWQVSGRNHLTFQQRVALEAWYARNWSLWLDIVIILKTFPTLLKRGQAF